MAMTVVGNLKHIGAVVGACNLAGFACTAVLETHKLTDLVGAGSFVVAAFSLSRRNGLLNLETFKNFRKSRQLLINGVVMIWGSRLASFLFGRVLHVGEDKRLKPFFRKPEEKYLDAEKSLFPLKLASFWAIQAMWGWMCMIPIALLNSKESGSQLSKGIRSNKFLRYGSLIIPFFAGLGGIIIESVADYQKYKYRNNKANDNHWCDVGLWSLSRHPNYFGELVVWWSIYFGCLPALTLGGGIVGLASPLFVSALILKVSGVPLLEDAADERYKENKEYDNYKLSTRLLAPVPR